MQDKSFGREALALYNVAKTQDAYYSPLAIFPVFFLKKALAEGRV